MNKNRRLIALLLVMVMTLTMCGSSVYAAGRGGRSWGWTKSDEEASQEADNQEALIVEDREVAEEVTEEDPAAAEDFEDLIAPEEEEVPITPEEEEPIVPEEDDFAILEDPEALEEEVLIFEDPVVPFDSDEVDGVTVHVDAPEGALPEGATMEVKKVDLAAVQDAVDKAENISGRVVAAVDITFKDADGGILDPQEDIRVTMTSDEIAKVEAPEVVHVPVEADEIEEADVEAEPVDQIDEPTAEDEVVFEAQDFSVYAVVDGSTADEARATVEFYGYNDVKVATFYVKNSDQLLGNGERQDNVSYIEDIVNDPGNGAASAIPAGTVFKGWYIGETADYTATTPTKDIQDVRAYLAGLSITEGMTVKVWAMNYTVYSITYLDEQNISRGTDEIYLSVHDDNTTAEYTVSQDYTPVDPTQNFMGWQTDDDSHISNAQYEGESRDEPYPMGTTMTISGSIVFTVNAPHGRWLVFDENGKGATYNAPQFVREGEVTFEPDLAKPANMKRLGYEFKGWYTVKYADGATVDPSKEFHFGGELTETSTTIYAKWDTVNKANYVVIFWEQNTEGNGYNFASSQTIEGNVGAAITVTASGSTVRVTGATNYTVPTGFSYSSADTGKTVAPEGNTVVNVYINRNEYTLSFQVSGTYYEPATGTGGDQYGFYNGEYVRIYYNNGQWYRTRTWQGVLIIGRWVYSNPYDGDRFTQANGWHSVKDITALYGQSIGDNFPIEGYANDRWKPQNDSVWNQVMVYVDTMPARNVTFHRDTANYTEKTMNYYVEALPGETGNLLTYNGVTYKRLRQLTPHYNFITTEDFVDLLGCEKVVALDTGNHVATTGGDPARYRYNGSDLTTVNFLYSRSKYSIIYFDGAYYNGNGIVMNDYEALGELREVKDIVYGSDVSSYNNYFVPESTYPGFVFEGWYIDDACTTPYTFTKMPNGSIKVYAKWRQVEYRVFMHPQATLPDGTNDPTLNWGSEDQDMTFRVGYGGSVSSPTGTRDEYEFIGWFLEDGSPFNTASKLTENIVKANYDKTDPKNYTDPMNRYGEIEGENGYNSDLTGNSGSDRFWITKKLDLYGKWSANLTGAEGIGVLYDANGGTNAPLDGTKYKDNVDAIAQGASTAPSDQRFLYWVVQKYENGEFVDTAIHVYPGDTFTVLKANAKETDLDPEDEEYEPGKVYKAYNVQLRAEYGISETPKDTHIIWYANGGKNNKTVADVTNKIANGDKTLTYMSLQINESIPVPAADTFSRAGYKFLGWAKYTEPSGAFSDNTVDESKFSEVAETGLTLWLQYNEDDGTFDELNAGGSTVIHEEITEVAADEAAPYQALYAVWEAQYFYIYHSSTGEVEQISLTDVNDQGEYDLAGKVEDGTLYGGYYSAYCDLTNDSFEDGSLKEGLTAWEYDGSKVYYKGLKSFWLAKNEITAEPGDAMTPAEGTVYFLKEVPEDYLTTRIQFVYDWSQDYKLNTIYLMTVVDDKLYDTVGFVLETPDESDKEAKLVSSFIFEQKDTGVQTVTKATDFGVARGYVGYADGGFATTGEFIAPNTEFKVTPYWITPDGVIVAGSPRAFTTGADGTKDTIEEVEIPAPEPEGP